MPASTFVLWAALTLPLFAADGSLDDWDLHITRAANLRHQGKIEETIVEWHAALAAAEKFGGQDVRLPRTLNNFGALLHELGRYKEEEPFYRRALALWEALEGPQSLNGAAAANNLAECLRVQGRFAEAEQSYLQAIHIREAQPLAGGSANALSLATSRNNLASLYRAVGRLKEAEPLYKQALETRVAAFGADSPQTAAILNNLGSLYTATERGNEAEALFRRVVAIREKTG